MLNGMIAVYTQTDHIKIPSIKQNYMVSYIKIDSNSHSLLIVQAIVNFNMCDWETLKGFEV